jgi:hypothetical protein
MTYTLAAIGVPTQENAMPSTPFDPLLLLLRRYEAIISAIKSTRPAEVAEAELDRICREGRQRTMREIISASPPTTTAEGAVAALDHVLADEAIWRENRKLSRQRNAAISDLVRPRFHRAHAAPDL